MFILTPQVAVAAQTSNTIGDSISQQSTDTCQPPANFNPISASNSDLKKYHFPSRPNNKNDLKQWEDVMKHAKYYIKPELTTSNVAITSSSNSNWSGYVVQASDNKYIGITPKFNEVQGTFTVPSNCGSCYPSYWVGIGGYKTNYVWQAGIQMNATALAGEPNYVEFWTENYPDYPRYVRTLPVSCNDKVTVCVYYGGAYDSYVWLANSTKNEYTTLTYDNAHIYVPHYDGGSSADFICESHFKYGVYPTSTFSYCLVASSTTPTYGLSNFSNAIRLILSSNGIVYQSPSSINSDNGFTTNR